MPRTITASVQCMTAVALLAGCSAADLGQTRQVGDYFITVTTDPPKLEVGSDAELTAHIVRDDEGLERCRVSFRQYMPDHQMTTDHTLHVMNDMGQGNYRARGTEFTMGGDWEVELQFNCGDGLKTTVFPYNLVWM